MKRGSRVFSRKEFSGFILIELLIVVAMIAVLAAMLVPAVQHAREASRRAQCLNNLKQMMTGMHNYEGAFRCFPSGYVDNAIGRAENVELPQPYRLPTDWYRGRWVGCDLIKEHIEETTVVSQWLMPPQWGWHALVLPHLGEGTIHLDYSKPKFGTSSDSITSDVYQILGPPPPPIPFVDTPSGMQPSPNEPYLGTNIATYICPSARNLPQSRAGIGASKNWGYATYRGSMGSFEMGMPSFDPPLSPPNCPPASGGNEPPMPNPVIPRYPNGLLYRNSAVKMGDVTDGTSNTLMIGDSYFGYWADGYSCCVRLWGEDADFSKKRYAFDHPQYYLGSYRPKFWDCYWWVKNENAQHVISMTPSITTQFFSFGGQHSGNLVCFGIVDGGAKAISKNMDRHALMALASRDGTLREYFPLKDIEALANEW